MARPLKDGVDYFPLDCHMNDAIKLLQAEFGIAGFGVLIKLWQKIYGNKGYYCEWNKEVALLFAQEVGLGGNVVSEIIAACLRRGIFDEKIYSEHGVLTSKGIQERYLAITQRRKENTIFSAYALVSYTQQEVNGDNNRVNVDNNRVNASNNPQSKGNKNKGNQSTSHARSGEKVRTAHRASAQKKEESPSSFDVDEFFQAALKNTYKGVT